MKICHVITRLILGGAQENTILTCEGQHARGHDVTLITGPALGPEGELMSRARRGGYRVIVLDEMRREIHPGRDIATYKSLVRHLRELRPDVMHSHSSKAGILARMAARNVGGMKIVHTIHGLAFHRYMRWHWNLVYITLEKRAARYTDAILCVADAMTAQALAAGVGRPDQYTTVYSGMEIEPYLNRTPAADAFRARLGVSSETILVTQVSRLAELKGHEYILAAARQVPDPHVHFCFVGDGHFRQKIEREIAASGMGGRFHLTGLLPPAEIPAVMQATDILVHCSLREGLARTLPQAMLAGKPVVSFDVDGAREVVSDSTGALLAPMDVDGLAQAIRKLSASVDLRAALGNNGRELCRKRFDHNVMVEEIQKVYDRLMAR